MWESLAEGNKSDNIQSRKQQPGKKKITFCANKRNPMQRRYNGHITYVEDNNIIKHQNIYSKKCEK